MTQLRVLNELPIADFNSKTIDIEVDVLRKEAIKWVKSLKEYKCILMRGEKVISEDFDNSVLRDWIINFFSINEDELE